MVDQSYGLRFDIYERVHLSDDVIGIDELEEIELYPKIQVIPGEEYAALRGHLLLSGVYRGEGETHRLEHLIPVEITIPLSRVNRLEDIAVEIENFDIDLLSARSLNITGVLSLQGIESSTLSPENQEWEGREFNASHDTVTEVHDVEEEPKSQFAQVVPEFVNQDEQQTAAVWNGDDSEVSSAGAWDTEATEAEAVISSTTPGQLESANYESNVWFKEQAYRPEESAGTISNAEEEKLETVEVSQQNVADEDVSAVPASVEVNSITESQDDELEVAVSTLAEEKKEMKIALGSKKDAQHEQENSFGITKLLSSKREEEVAIVQQVELEEVAQTEPRDGEDVHWKNLFTGTLSEDTTFRKMKLVIVQREETIDDIAERYHLSIRELQLYNRLSEHNLSEGQVLYIP